jgi:hypothetical protein
MSHLGTRACTYRVSGVPPSVADKIRVGSRPRSARLRRRRAAIADFPLAARPANATIFTASGPVGVSEN